MLNIMVGIHVHVCIVILVLTIFPTIHISEGENVQYKACSTNFSCGSIKNVGYPFWGGSRPQYCGLEELQLICPNGTDDYPSINVDMYPKKAEVIEINTSAETMVIALHRFLRPDRVCHDSLTQPTLTLPETFKLNSNDKNISLFFKCPGSVSTNLSKSYSCLYKNSPRKGSVFYFLNRSGSTESEMRSCTAKFTLPVLGSALNELNDGNATLLSVLQKGFEVQYEANLTACLACQNSGGHCGSSKVSPSKLVCHCPAGSQALLCINSGGTRSNKMILIGSASAAAGIGLLVLLLICSRRRSSSKKFTFAWIKGTTHNQNVEAFLESYGSLAPKRYTYAYIKKMTNSFKERLGEGGYGHVYKGKLVDGRFVAVKVLKKLNGKGEEFINEVVSISRTNHVNVVTLLGFCFEGEKRALVYEFLPNGSLEKFIHNADGGQALSCENLFRIAVGIARGLDYLHRGCNTRILHFDIKPHNILLDENLCPKISDFGLARLFPKEQSHVMTFGARGTIGYIAPEVFCRNFGAISHKSDVYSFGMMVIDMVCGRKKNSAEANCSSTDHYFPQWIYDQLEVERGSTLEEIADNDHEENRLKTKMILVSLWCIQTYPSHRPSMNEVAEMLEGSLESLQMPPGVVFVWSIFVHKWDMIC